MEQMKYNLNWLFTHIYLRKQDKYTKDELLEMIANLINQNEGTDDYLVSKMKEHKTVEGESEE